MKSIAMFNNKGGVGKTTLVCNLASYISTTFNKKVLLIDTDPQCNSTVNLLDDSQFDTVYYNKEGFTVYDVLRPLYRGEGYSKDMEFTFVTGYNLDLLVGDPRLSLMEDLLSNDWRDAIAGMPRGLKTTLVFSELLSRCSEYDYVFFDMGPSLGSLNRAILLACDYFMTPMSSDIFSLLAVENIGQTLQTWKTRISQGVSQNDEPEMISNIKSTFNLRFAGYVTQQYSQKTVDGEKRPVKAYEYFLQQIPELVEKEIISRVNIGIRDLDYNLGSVPNFHSVIPMSQTAHKPVFRLEPSDGIVGSHFSRVKEFEKVIKQIADNLIVNLEALQ